MVDHDAGALRLTLYSRAYCHLCHDMQAALEALPEAAAFELEVLDVDADPELELRFNELVPVLMHGDQELARYRLDAAALTAYLQSLDILRSGAGLTPGNCR